MNHCPPTSAQPTQTPQNYIQEIELNSSPSVEDIEQNPLNKSSPSDVVDTQVIECTVNFSNKQTTALDEVDSLYRATISLSDTDVDKAYKLEHCADLFLRRFRSGQDKEDIEQAISAYELAMSFLTQESQSYLQCQHKSGNALLSQFEITSAISDINRAIFHFERLASRTPDEHPAKSSRLNLLGIAQVRRFQHTNNLEDLNNAIANQQRAVQLTSEDHNDITYRLHDLGISYSKRFGALGTMSDITAAISCQERALNNIKDNPDAIATCHTNLGASFRDRFNHSGDPSDVLNAIHHGQQAIHLTPEGDYRLSRRLNNLAVAYIDRHEFTKDISDLSNAIATQKKAMDLSPDSAISKSACLNNLGTMYRRQFDLTQDLKDISFAISRQQEAIKFVPKSHLYLSIILTNLGNSYLDRFRRSGDLYDISNAVSNAEMAVRLTPTNHADLAMRVNSLGNAYSRRFERTGNKDDLSSCVTCHERAVQLTPEGHAIRPQWLQNLGKAYLRRYQSTKDESDLRLALTQYRSSAISVSGAPSIRLASARKWAGLSLLNDPGKMEAYGVTVDLISRVAGLNQTVKRRHINLIDISSLTAEAAALAFSKGKYRSALEWLEQGRCLVWNQLNQLRTPLNNLYAHDKELANRLWVVSKKLESLGSRAEALPSSTGLAVGKAFEGEITLEEKAREHIKLAQEWDNLLVKVREISGFQDFLRPRRAEDLIQNLPETGYVVYINISKYQSDALILRSGGEPVHVPLRNFSYRKAEALREQLNASLKLNGVRNREAVDRGTFRLNSGNENVSTIQYVLSELWMYAALPIMANINTIKPLTGSTRIWWCSTGPLAFLPLHAAGKYHAGGTTKSSVPYFAVSSYIPTVSYLVDNINRLRRPSTKFLLINQTDAPNFPVIPGTRQEAQNLIDYLKEAGECTHMQLDGNQATVETVKKEMTQYPLIHLACHASQDTVSPLQSGFYLHDGCLELGDIIKLRIPNADFAFLSACQTSAGDEKLSEEAVHLAAGMLAAGYQSIVATMWSISDLQGPEIAKVFYRHFFDIRTKLDDKGLSGIGAAYALHSTMRDIRKEVKDTENGLILWVPYVHFGV